MLVDQRDAGTAELWSKQETKSQLLGLLVECCDALPCNAVSVRSGGAPNRTFLFQWLDSHGPDCQIGTFSDRIVRVISLPPAYLHESGLCGSSVKTQYVVLARDSCDPPQFLGCGDFLSLD